MSSSSESLIYNFVRGFGAFIRTLPLPVALAVGRFMGMCGYYLDIRHKSVVVANLRTAFSKTKSPKEIRQITKEVFKNYGQNVIDLLRLPLLNKNKFKELVDFEGSEHILEARRQNRGVILVVMHFGSWEIANLACAMIDCPYKVIVNPQNKFSQLDKLLNSYRECGGSVVFSRGFGTRELIRSLKNNEAIGMITDQGGKEGEQIPFFGRKASMSSGAFRIALKWNVPICFSVIIRKKGGRHDLIALKPFELHNSGDEAHDVSENLKRIIQIMEHYISEHPGEYMWFYKIWKYSKDATVLILSDGKKGHVRQSETVSSLLEEALSGREIKTKTEIVQVEFKSHFSGRMFSVVSFLCRPFIANGRLDFFLEKFLTPESYRALTSIKADFVVSCGSSIAGVNYLLSVENQAKSIAILKPGILGLKRFDLIVLPQLDHLPSSQSKAKVIITKGAPNLIDDEYLRTQSELLLKRFSHLKSSQKTKIGILIGGDNKNYHLTEDVIKIFCNQIKEASEQINADILLTTSRRTSSKIENLIIRELKKHPRCQLLIVANRMDVPEAVGGILGLSDILVVSGDSVSMISEAASSGKETIVFPITRKKRSILASFKHEAFIEKLNEQGFIISSDVKNLSLAVHNIAKNKIQTKRMDDRPALLAALKEVI